MCCVIEEWKTVCICVCEFSMVSAAMIWFGTIDTIFSESNQGFKIYEFVSVKKEIL